MGQAIFIAALTGFASALLSGMLTPSSMSFAMLFMLAPLPLFIAGFGWHALVAALGGLIGALLIDLAVGNRGSIAFAMLLALPAFVITSASERAFNRDMRDPARDGIAVGQIGAALVIYIALVVVASAIWVEGDYALFVSRLREFVALGLRQMGGPGSVLQTDAASLNRMVDLMAMIMLPVSGLLIVVTIVLSACLGAIIADKATRMTYPRPRFNEFRLPGGALFLFAVAIILGLQDGYLGVFAEIVALGLALLLILQGLAVFHTRLIGNSSRGMLIAAAWASILVFGLPALLFLGAGMLDHLFDLRRRKPG
ncbi:Protein of unknown function DUF2232 [Rhabdaerophilaceae bacterium]